MSPERFLHPVTPAPRPAEGDLRATVERLAVLRRPPCSPGERRAAELIAERMGALGAAARVEEEPAYGSPVWPVGALSAMAALASTAGRRAGVLGGALAAAGLAGEAACGLARRLLSPRRTTWNVVAGVGDATARRTLVVMAHHDAAPELGGLPRLAERPSWWPTVAGPALVAAGAAVRLPLVRRTGAVLSAASAAAMAALGTRRAVPGANDDLSGVAVLTSLAASFGRRPLPGLRVILLSAGAEEAAQEGARGFARRHFPNLARDSTWFLNLDTVGSGRLVLLDAEGALQKERYDPGFGDLIARCGTEQGIRVRRGTRARAGTDGVVPLRHGYRAACLVSVDDHGRVPHHHLPSDGPEHVDYRCVADAAQLTEAVARALSRRQS